MPTYRLGGPTNRAAEDGTPPPPYARRASPPPPYSSSPGPEPFRHRPARQNTPSTRVSRFLDPLADFLHHVSSDARGLFEGESRVVREGPHATRSQVSEGRVETPQADSTVGEPHRAHDPEIGSSARRGSTARAGDVTLQHEPRTQLQRRGRRDAQPRKVRREARARESGYRSWGDDWYDDVSFSSLWDSDDMVCRTPTAEELERADYGPRRSSPHGGHKWWLPLRHWEDETAGGQSPVSQSHSPGHRMDRRCRRASELRNWSYVLYRDNCCDGEDLWCQDRDTMDHERGDLPLEHYQPGSTPEGYWE